MRYSNGMKEAIRRIHDGVIGQPTSLFANDYRGTLWVKPRQPGWTDMEYQMRNWYYYTWLSGDFNVEQHIHMLDVAAWVMKNEYPIRAIGMGGRAARTGPEYGHIYDHFSVIYEYPNGVRLVGSCRQQVGTKNEISCHVLGGKGRAVLSSRDDGLFIRGENGEWVFPGPSNDMFQTEHDELFASIRNGQPINNGDYMAKSTLLAIMGRMAAYTGQQITWEMALNSREDLSPPAYDWSVQLPEPAVAVPGKTKFV
jgi:predicted dehydrogenase